MEQKFKAMQESLKAANAALRVSSDRHYAALTREFERQGELVNLICLQQEQTKKIVNLWAEERAVLIDHIHQLQAALNERGRDETA